MNIKKLICLGLAATMSISASIKHVICVHAEDNAKTDLSMKIDMEKDETKASDIAGYIYGTNAVVNELIEQMKFSYSRGVGFAAEQGNNLKDVWAGLNAKVVGGNNLKNGADRIIEYKDGTTIWIQDKYCCTAAQSVKAAFENGTYRYVDPNGKPMQLEVPADQYAEAVELMKKSIANGEVKGVTDPEQANTIVRKGGLTYKQAKNLAKAGTFESLKYDAANGAVAATGAFGISTAISFAILSLNGYEFKDALKESAMSGLKSGAVVFITDILAGQISKTQAVKGLAKSLRPTVEKLTGKFGEGFARAIAGVGKNAVYENVSSYASKVLAQNIISSVILTAVLSANDIRDLFRGRISVGQFYKDLAETSLGIVGGNIGYIAGGALGTLIGPGIGTAIGSILGSMIVGGLTYGISGMVLDKITEDDAEQMLDIINAEFAQMAEDYIISEKEAEYIIEKLMKKLDSDTLKDMYAAGDRNGFAGELLTPLFEEAAKSRAIQEPSDDEMRHAVKESLKDVVYIH